ncbi:hypothetical protein D9M68_183620 [compost metagenome]
MTAQQMLDNLYLLDESEHLDAKRAQDIDGNHLRRCPRLGKSWLRLGRETLAPLSGYEVIGMPNPDNVSAAPTSRWP